MKRYETDRYGMICSADIADALRRAAARRRQEDHDRRAREERRLARRARGRSVLGRVRDIVSPPPASASV